MIAHAQILEQADNHRLAQICNRDAHQTYPASIMNYDSHGHWLLDYVEYNSNVTPPYEIGVVISPRGFFDKTRGRTYQQADVIQQFNTYLHTLGEIGRADAPLNIHFARPDFYAKFVRRQVLAAIDYLAKINLDRDFDPEFTEAWADGRELDYLLQTVETIVWYLSDPQRLQNYQPSDICLLRENLTYYFNTYAPDFDSNVRTLLLSLFPSYWDEPTMYYCAVVANYLNQSPFPEPEWIYQDIRQFNYQQQTRTWSSGYLYPLDFYPPEFTTVAGEKTYQYLFRHDLNALAAGMLAAHQ
jgi:hypothetical protein